MLQVIATLSRRNIQALDSNVFKLAFGLRRFRRDWVNETLSRFQAALKARGNSPVVLPPLWYVDRCMFVFHTPPPPNTHRATRDGRAWRDRNVVAVDLSWVLFCVFCCVFCCVFLVCTRQVSPQGVPAIHHRQPEGPILAV